MKRFCKNKPAHKSHPKSRPTRKPSSSDVPCDICHENNLASRSCLICKISYCEIHLMPHLRDPEMTKHRLLDPATFNATHLCKQHNQFLTKFCENDQKPVCMKCTESGHKYHDTITIDNKSKRVRVRMALLVLSSDKLLYIFCWLDCKTIWKPQRENILYIL